MTLIREPGRRRVALAAILSLGLGVATVVHAQETPEDSETTVFTETTEVVRSPAAGGLTLDGQRVYNAGGSENTQQGSFADGFSDDTPTTWGLFSRILIFLILITGIAYAVVHFARKGKMNLGALRAYSADEHLVISETRMLGNRQYLMVVEYGNQKMLLGVTQGSIRHLCFLESGYDEEVTAAMDQEFNRGEQA